MNRKQWIENQQNYDEICITQKLCDSIKAKNINPTDIYFEYLVIRLIAAIGNFKNFEFSMKLDDDFKPKSFASGKPDLIVSYDDLQLIGEATLRPISGKVDHFSHLDEESESKQLGILFVQDIEKVALQVWNTYKVYSQEKNKLFMICDVRYLLDLIKSDQKIASNKFLNFVKNSENIWKTESNWKSIRAKVIFILQKN